MTDFSTAMEPGRANNPPGMPPPAAVVKDGVIQVLDLGRYWPRDPSAAWCEWLRCYVSRSPVEQARAREIRAALNEIGYLQ